MSRSSKTLRVLIRTSIMVSNREAANVFLSYLAYSIGGLVLASVAIVPVVTPLSKDALYSLFGFVLFIAMFDYFFIQTKLTGTVLTDRAALILFPLSRIRSTAFRFVLTLLDKRIVFYLVPMLAEIIVLSRNRGAGEILVMLLLFLPFYLITSEVLTAVYPILRKLADRFSPRTVTQVTILPMVLLFLIPSIFHLRPDFFFHIPVASEFAIGSRDAISGDTAGAMVQAAKMLLIALAAAAVFVVADFTFAKMNLKLRFAWARESSRNVGNRNPSVRSSGPVIDDAGGISTRDALPVSAGRRRRLTVGRLVLLDWKIRQKEERFLYMILIYPFTATMLAQIVVQRIRQPWTSLIFPVFFVTLMLGLAVTENYVTQHGLRLKHISIFPADHRRFIFVKSFSTWAVIAAVDLVVTSVLGFRLHVGVNQVLQGTIYSLYISLVMVQLANTIILFFNALSRHAIISVIVVLVVEVFATFIYVLVMLFNVAVGVVFVAGLVLLTYFLWIPAWGKRQSLEFQTLLEESK